MAITGIHAILYNRDASSARAWVGEMLGLDSVDAGGGWRIFALPPAELAAHPASGDSGDVELYLMCDNIEGTVRELEAKGATIAGDVTDQGWGRLTTITLPGGGRLGLYE